MRRGYRREHVSVSVFRRISQGTRNSAVLSLTYNRQTDFDAGYSPLLVAAILHDPEIQVWPAMLATSPANFLQDDRHYSIQFMDLIQLAPNFIHHHQCIRTCIH